MTSTYSYRKTNLVESNSFVSGFIAKLPPFRAELRRKDFKKSPRLNEVNTHVVNDALLIFLNDITNIEADTKEQFMDSLSLEIPT